MMNRQFLLALLSCFGLLFFMACSDSSLVDNNNIIDDGENLDLQHIYVFPLEITVTETGEGQRIAVDFIDRPLSDVMIVVKVNDDIELTVAPESMVIEPDDWGKDMSFYISGIDDGIRDGDQVTTVSFTFISEDPDYHLDSPIDVVVKIVDDGVFGGTGYKIKYFTELVTSEDGSKTAEIGLALSSPPTGDVALNIISSNPNEGRPEPASMTFTPENYSEMQTLKIVGVDDDVLDGDQSYEITITASSIDPRYDKNEVLRVELINLDNEEEEEEPSGGSHTIRLMASNLSTGRYQSYDPGHGMRIMEAMKPDIIMIQEFTFRSGSTSDQIKAAFGEEYTYYRGGGNLPNGVISRYKILSSGSWSSRAYSNRDWDWAVIDIPGPKDMLLVSVHLHTSKNASEMPGLRDRIKAKIENDNKDYYVVIGGDFNTNSRGSVQSNFSANYATGGPYPVDQEGNDGTNAARTKPYDWILFAKDVASLETPLQIGKRTYPNGHVFDARVYEKLGELGDVPPVQAGDSSDEFMQHMGVIREITYVY